MAVGEPRRLDRQQLVATLRHVVKQGEVRTRHKRSVSGDQMELILLERPPGKGAPSDREEEDEDMDLTYDSDSSDLESSRHSASRQHQSALLGPMCLQDDLLTRQDRQMAARRLLQAANHASAKIGRRGILVRADTMRRIQLWRLFSELFALERASFRFYDAASQCERSATRARYIKLAKNGADNTPLGNACFAMGTFLFRATDRMGGVALMEAVQESFPSDECRLNDVCKAVSRRGWSFRAKSDEFCAAFRAR